mmetsp:Transcript_28409/g.94316  ORF Transcript_28409/g.94316 Transcript_28409/m.94316 type:complete len:325 (-) Transcript_28409:240-1214(-)
MRDAGRLQRRPVLPPEVEPIDATGEVVSADDAIMGRGAYGVVRRGRDRATNAWCAVHQSAVDRYDRDNFVEVQVNIREHPHPCLVRVREVFEEAHQGCLSIVMEFCASGDLFSRIRANVQPHQAYHPPAESLSWIGQLLLGLEHLHTHIAALHLDVKPDNVLLDRDYLHAKLSLGEVSRAGLQHAPWDLYPPGSPGYAAPEILRREHFDEGADLYSLGVLIWVLLTGGLSVLCLPPMSRFDAGDRFRVLAQDWKSLRRHVEEGTPRALTPAEADLVLRLVTETPAQRMSRDEFREHELLQPLHLPALTTGVAGVEEWLDRPLAL